MPQNYKKNFMLSSAEHVLGHDISVRQHSKSEHLAPCHIQTQSQYDWKIVESNVKPKSNKQTISWACKKFYNSGLESLSLTTEPRKYRSDVSVWTGPSLSADRNIKCCINPVYWDRQAWANCRPRSEYTACCIWSGFILFATHPAGFNASASSKMDLFKSRTSMVRSYGVPIFRVNTVLNLSTDNKWARTWQNVQSSMCAQWRLRSAWASAQADQSLLSAWRKHGSLATIWAHMQWRLWWDWADA